MYAMINEFFNNFDSTWPNWVHIIVVAYFIIVNTILGVLYNIERYKLKDSKNSIKREGFDKLLNDEEPSDKEKWKLYYKFDRTLWLKWNGPVISF